MLTLYGALLEVEHHPTLGSKYAKLSNAERAHLVKFCETHYDREPHVVEEAIDRMFLDVASKPKNWALISELLSNANTIYRVSKNPRKVRGDMSNKRR